MSITPISPSVPACYGVACDRHATCARYAAVENRDALHFIATCEELGERPLFVDARAGAEA